MMSVSDLKWQTFLFQAFVSRVPDCFCSFRHFHFLLATRKCFTDEDPTFFLARKSKVKEWGQLLESDRLKLILLCPFLGIVTLFIFLLSFKVVMCWAMVVIAFRANASKLSTLLGILVATRLLSCRSPHWCQ